MKILQAIAIEIAVVILLTGCITTAKDTNRLSVGMTKQEAVSVLGQPESTAAPGNSVEILRYHLLNTGAGGVEEYYVRLVNGNVESYGKMGDFDSTKDPTLNLDIKNR